LCGKIHEEFRTTRPFSHHEKKFFLARGYLPTIVQNKLQPTQKKDFILTTVHGKYTPRQILIIPALRIFKLKKSLLPKTIEFGLF
jgi:hypothetical protein